MDWDPVFRTRASLLPVVHKEDGRLERLPSVTIAMDDSLQELIALDNSIPSGVRVLALPESGL